MKSKTQTLSNVERYVAWMHTRGYDVQTLRKDEGTEYSSSTIADFLRVNGINHALYGRSAHAQLHVAEKMSRTLTEMARTMHFQAGLPKSWWVNAIKYATSIRNKCTTSTFENREIPFEPFFNRGGYLSLYKPFGCTALIFVPLQNRTKLDETSERGVLVGMDEGT